MIGIGSGAKKGDRDIPTFKYFHFCFFVILLLYIYLIPLVTLQMWINDVKYNQVLNQTLVPPGVNSQAEMYSDLVFK